MPARAKPLTLTNPSPFPGMAHIDQTGLTRIAGFVLEDAEKHLTGWIREGP
ncbi:MAG: hypothetical protein ABSD48_08080 [Armatimonadota bacterium]